MGWFSALPALDAVQRSEGEVLGRRKDGTRFTPGLIARGGLEGESFT